MYADATREIANRSNYFDEEDIRILRFRDVVNRTGLSKSAIYQQIRAGCFPRPIAIGSRSVGFVRCEINEHLRTLVEQSRQSAKCSSPDADTRQMAMKV